MAGVTSFGNPRCNIIRAESKPNKTGNASKSKTTSLLFSVIKISLQLKTSVLLHKAIVARGEWL